VDSQQTSRYLDMLTARAKEEEMNARGRFGARAYADSTGLLPQASGGFSSSRTEKMFRAWYQAIVAPTGENPDPDSPTHAYDWRGAFLAGAKPKQDERGNWSWPGDFAFRGREGQPGDNPNWRGGMPVPVNPTFEPKNDIRDPIGIWSRKYKGWAGDL
jgi:hypothetical protein